MRIFKWVAGLILAWMVGAIPACGTMGGGRDEVPRGSGDGGYAETP